MLKKILAILAGIVAAVVTISAIEMISTSMYPYPEGMDTNNMEAFKAYVSTLPTAAFVLVMLGHLVGAFMGGLVATLVVKNSMKPGVIVGGIFTGIGLLNLLMLNIHPTWMWSELVLYIPFAFLGSKLVLKKV